MVRFSTDLAVCRLKSSVPLNHEVIRISFMQSGTPRMTCNVAYSVRELLNLLFQIKLVSRVDRLATCFIERLRTSGL